MSVAVAMRVRSMVSSACAVEPVTTANDRATERWVIGMRAAAGAATALVMPGTISTGIPAHVARQEHLLAAAPEHEWITPLEAHDHVAARGLAHEQGADLSLLHRLPARFLADVDAAVASGGARLSRAGAARRS